MTLALRCQASLRFFVDEGLNIAIGKECKMKNEGAEEKANRLLKKNAERN
jgi:hypothetical protein